MPKTEQPKEQIDTGKRELLFMGGKIFLGLAAAGGIGNLFRLATKPSVPVEPTLALGPNLVANKKSLAAVIERSKYTQKLNDTLEGVFAQGEWNADSIKRFSRSLLDAGIGTVIGLHKSKGYYTKVLNIGIAVDGLIEKTAKILGANYEFAKGVNRTENSGGFNVFSKDGAAGMFQIVASTAEMLGLKIDKINKSLDQRLNAFTAAIGGVAYLRHLIYAYSRKPNFQNLASSEWLFNSGYVGLGMIRKAADTACPKGCSPQDIGEAVLKYPNEPSYHQRYPYYVVGHTAIDYLGKLCAETVSNLDKKAFQAVVGECNSILSQALQQYAEICEQYVTHLEKAKDSLVAEPPEQAVDFEKLKSITGEDKSAAELRSAFEQVRQTELVSAREKAEAARGFLDQRLHGIASIEATNPLYDWLLSHVGVQIMVGFLPLSEDRKVLELSASNPKRFGEELVNNVITKLFTTPGWAERLRSGGIESEGGGIPAEVDPQQATREQPVELHIQVPDNTPEEEDNGLEIEL